jgi:DDE superfamily endonuclease
VVAHLGACGQLGLLDATEVRVRRSAAKAGRHRFVSGKARVNTVKALVITDADGRLLFCGQTRPGGSTSCRSCLRSPAGSSARNKRVHPAVLTVRVRWSLWFMGAVRMNARVNCDGCDKGVTIP